MCHHEVCLQLRGREGGRGDVRISACRCFLAEVERPARCMGTSRKKTPLGKVKFRFGCGGLEGMRGTLWSVSPSLSEGACL